MVIMFKIIVVIAGIITAYVFIKAFLLYHKECDDLIKKQERMNSELSKLIVGQELNKKLLK